MRKQDRIAQERETRQHDEQQQPDTTNRPESPRTERITGSAAAEQIRRPERQGGKLPLPD
jgi:hypothetical protein